MYIASKLNNISLIAAFIVAGAPLTAQVTTGTLVGTVRDRGNDRPIAGATVTVASPNLMSPRTMRSDAQGNWRLALLPPGEYRVVFSMEGYRGSSIQGIRVGIDTTQRADIKLASIGAAEETVEVVAEGIATVDKNDTKVGANYSAEQLFSMPVGTSLSGAAYLTPGTVQSQGSGEVSIRGGTTNATLYRLNGVDFKNDYQGTQTSTGFLPDMIEDVQINVSPLHPRHGRSSGGSMNVVTKAGSNTFSGSARAVSLSRTGSWYANKTGLIASDFTGTRFDDSLNKTYDITLLGPIIKDKLWFSIATRIVPDTAQSLRIPTWTNYPNTNSGPMRIGNTGVNIATYDALNRKLENGPDGFSYTHFNAGDYYLRRDTRSFYEGKLTYTFLQNHTLEYVASFEQQKISNRDQYSGGSYLMTSMLSNQISDYTVWGISYRGVYGSSTFVEARYNSNTTEIDWPKPLHPTIQDPISVYIGRTNSTTGGPGTNLVAFSGQTGFIGTELRGNKSWNVNAKHYWYGLGSHESDVGVEQYTGRLRRPTLPGPNGRRIHHGGGVYVQDGFDVNDPNAEWRFATIVWEGASRNGQTSSGLSGPATTLRQYWGQDGEQNPTSTSIYLADLWNITDNWNILVGFRYDMYKIIDTDGAELAKSSQFIPRVQVKYDPTGDSKHLISLSYATYADDFYTGFTNGFAKTASSTYTTYGWTGSALSQPLVGDGTNLEALKFITYADLVNMENWKRDGAFNTFDFVSPDANAIDPNMKPTIAHEVSLRYQRQFENKSTFSVTATQKTWAQNWAIWQEWDPSNWTRLNDPSGSARVVYSQIAAYGNSEELKRDYYGLEIDYNHILNKNWTLWTGIGYSSLKGNDQGGDQSSSFRDNGSTSYFLHRNILLRATPPAASGRDHWTADDFANYGYLLSHQLLKGRVTLTGRFPLDKGGFLTFALMGEYNSGDGGTHSPTTTNQIGTFTPLSTLPTDGTTPTRPTTFTRFFMPRGSWTTNDFFRFDLKFTWQVPVGVGKLRVIGDMQVNNLFNNMRQTGISKIYQSDSTNPVYVPLAQTPSIYGSTQPGTDSEKNYYNTARNANFSIGLRF